MHAMQGVTARIHLMSWRTNSDLSSNSSWQEETVSGLGIALQSNSQMGHRDPFDDVGWDPSPVADLEI